MTLNQLNFAKVTDATAPCYYYRFTNGKIICVEGSIYITKYVGYFLGKSGYTLTETATNPGKYRFNSLWLRGRDDEYAKELFWEYYTRQTEKWLSAAESISKFDVAKVEVLSCVSEQ